MSRKKTANNTAAMECGQSLENQVNPDDISLMPGVWSDLSPIQIIRTETVLSRLPIHSLAKKGSFEVQVVRRKPTGEVTLYWVVSHNAKYGPPRQLAYKLDTLVVNRRVDECGRPIPRLIRLGSLRDIARELSLGGDTNQIRKALKQNAFTGISAKLTYRSTDGTERRIEADFTRYSVVFAGEKLPDGREADAVHLVFNEPYLEVLNQAPMRPLNYDYLKELPPAAQRFYEIVSFRVYATLKYARAEARLTYSDFCTFSALQRYADYDHFKKQMYKIHRPHFKSGYLSRAYYEDATDHEGKPDWVMVYLPGPKARAEFAAFDRRSPAGGQGGEETNPGERLALEELLRRGIEERQARRILSQGRPHEEIIERLAWGDHLVTNSRGRIRNPPGFYSYLLEANVLPPAEFRRTCSPAPATAPAPAAEDAQSRLEYEEYRRNQIEQHLRDNYTAEEHQRLVEEKGREVRRQYRAAEFWSQDYLRQIAEGMVRAEAAPQAKVDSYAEWMAQARRTP